MRKLAAIALAGALATASVGATTESANATTAGGFIAGLVVGAVVVAAVHHLPPFNTTTRAFAFAPVDHVAWCRAHYPRSYNATTNLFIGNDRKYHECVVY